MVICMVALNQASAWFSTDARTADQRPWPIQRKSMTGRRWEDGGYVAEVDIRKRARPIPAIMPAGVEAALSTSADVIVQDGRLPASSLGDYPRLTCLSARIVVLNSPHTTHEGQRGGLGSFTSPNTNLRFPS